MNRVELFRPPWAARLAKRQRHLMVSTIKVGMG